MIKIENIGTLEEFELKGLHRRSEALAWDKDDVVRSIIDAVKMDGNDAIFEYTRKFDGVDLDAKKIKVSQKEFDTALSRVGQDYIDAIKLIIGRLTTYHEMQLPRSFEFDLSDGVSVGREWSSIERVGLYVPGGKAPYASACYMLGVPAKVAGCKRVVICSPPNKDGEINPHILASAYLSGVTEVYKVGGAQAIAGLAYGTETIPRVNKIFGPGNVYVTAAKLMVIQDVAIDMPAGPSEAMIISDGCTKASYVAADILSQAEHDPNSASILLTTSESEAKAVLREVMIQLDSLDRKEIAAASLQQFGRIIVCPDITVCLEIANFYAPEHLQLLTENCDDQVKEIRNCGSVCVGMYSPVAFGDYVCGTNNVIPTGGATKMYSPTHTESFMKSMQTQRVTLSGLASLIEPLKLIAEQEGFGAHYNSVKIRFDDYEC